MYINNTESNFRRHLIQKKQKKKTSLCEKKKFKTDLINSFILPLKKTLKIENVRLWTSIFRYAN